MQIVEYKSKSFLTNWSWQIGNACADHVERGSIPQLRLMRIVREINKTRYS